MANRIANKQLQQHKPQQHREHTTDTKAKQFCCMFKMIEHFQHPEDSVCFELSVGAAFFVALLAAHIKWERKRRNGRKEVRSEKDGVSVCLSVKHIVH